MDQAFLQSLETTLKQITGPSTVKEASARLQNEFYKQDQTLPALIHILQQHPDHNIRQLAGVEARKLVGKVWQDSVNNQFKGSIKQSLLSSTLREQNGLVRHTSARVVSAIAKLELTDNQWSDLLPFLYNTVKSANAAEREVAVYLLYTLLEADVEILIDSSVELLHLFAQTINDPESQQVRISTVLGLGKVSENIDATSVTSKVQISQNPVELFRALIPSMVEVLKQAISSNDEKAVFQIFEVFNTILLVDPALVAKHIGDLITFMLSNIACETQISDDYRIAALQFLHTAIRFKKSKIQSLKLGPTLVNSAIRIVAEGYEDALDDDDEENDEDTPYLIALRMVDSLSSSLPPSQVAGPILSALPSCVKSDQPAERRAGFLALTACVEGSPDFVANNIEQVLTLVVKGLEDGDVAVKVSALQALAMLATELDDLVSKEHQILLPLVFNIMDGATTLKIGKAACLALDAILEVLDRKVISELYLSSLIPRLLQLLDGTQNLKLKSSIVAAISSAAFSAGKNFMPYFEHTIHSLEPFVRIATGDDEIPEENVALCGITLDALSATASAVGKDVFRPYVEPLIQAAYKCITSDKSRLKECGFIFLSTLAKLYELEFTPFLDTVVPEIFKCIEQDEFAGLADDDDDDEENEQIGIDDDEEDDNNYAVNSAMAMEKEIAIDALGEIIVSTKSDSSKYLEKATELLVESAQHFYDGVTKASLIALWRTFTTFYKLSNPHPWAPGFPATYTLPEPAATIGKMVRTVTQDLLTQTDERSVAIVICDNVAEAIKIAGPAIIGEQGDLESLCAELILILEKAHLSQSVEEDDYDNEQAKKEEESGEVSEYDEVLIDSALDLVVQLAAGLGPQFNPMLHTFYPILNKYCTSSSISERASGAGSIAEIINGLRFSCGDWTQQFFQTLLTGLNDRDLEVRSNSAYGIGLLCFYSPETAFIKSQYNTILQKLQRLLQKVDKSQRQFGNSGVANESDSNDRGLANACGCVARMAMKYPEQIPISEVVPALLSRLPLQDGYEENTPVFEFILAMFHSKDSTILSLKEQVVQVFEKVFIQQAEVDKNEAERPVSNNPLPSPFETDQLKNSVIELLRFLESEQPGFVSSRPGFATVLA